MRTYRTTFGEYARKLEELQRLLDTSAADKHQLESAMREVECARTAHRSARDRLACELLGENPGVESPFDAPVVRATIAATAA